MSTLRLSRALVGTLLLVSSALSTQVQARPRDPLWHPVVSIKATTEKPCGPIVKPAWSCPHGAVTIHR